MAFRTLDDDLSYTTTVDAYVTENERDLRTNYIRVRNKDSVDVMARVPHCGVIRVAVHDPQTMDVLTEFDAECGHHRTGYVWVKNPTLKRGGHPLLTKRLRALGLDAGAPCVLTITYGGEA